MTSLADRDESRRNLFNRWRDMGLNFEDSMSQVSAILRNPPSREGWTLVDLTEWGRRVESIRAMHLADLDKIIQQTREHLGFPEHLELGAVIRGYTIPVFPEALTPCGDSWEATWEAPEWMRVSGFDTAKARFDLPSGDLILEDAYRIRVRFSSSNPGVSSIRVTW